MTIALYMDENVPRQITFGLRLREVDVLTVQEDLRAGDSDPLVMLRAIYLLRVLFTRDDDFLTIARDYQRENKSFSGVIYAPQQIVSIGDCIRDLEAIAKACDPEDCANYVQFLPL